MARPRTPAAIPVNGAAMLIKDPDAGTADIFSDYQRVPGFASFTMPDEVGSSNEVTLMDGSVATAQVAGVGTITGTIGSLTGHATHRYLSDRKKDGKEIEVAIIRPAAKVDDGSGAVENAANGTVITIPNALANNLKSKIKEGMLIAIGATGDTPGGGCVVYGDTITNTNDHHFRPIIYFNEAATKIKVEVAITTALTSGTTNKWALRIPGIRYENIRCTVSGFGDGDFQSGGVVSGTITLQPIVAVPTMRPEYRTLAELRTDSTWADSYGTVD